MIIHSWLRCIKYAIYLLYGKDKWLGFALSLSYGSCFEKKSTILKICVQSNLNVFHLIPNGFKQNFKRKEIPFFQSKYFIHIFLSLCFRFRFLFVRINFVCNASFCIQCFQSHTSILLVFNLLLSLLLVFFRWQSILSYLFKFNSLKKHIELILPSVSQRSLCLWWSHSRS